MKTTTSFRVNLCLFTVLLAGCAAPKVSTTKRNPPLEISSDQQDSIVVMTYNVENLFDTVDDDDRNDETFLPIEKKQNEAHKELCRKNNGTNERYLKECLEFDWSEELLSLKVNRIAEVILSVNDGNGPDVLIVEEVENINALRILNRALGDKAYPTEVLLEGPDVRGIDVGMLSRFPLKNAELHAIPLVEYDLASRPTRSILQADYELPGGDILTAFGVHFPSPGHKNSERVLAFSVLKEAFHHLPDNRMVVAGGDFNITSENDDKTNIIDFEMGRDFMASHKVGCGDCQGTSYFHYTDEKYRWSFLDIIFASNNMEPGKATAPYELDKSSIFVAKDVAFQSDNRGQPQRFFSWEWDAPRGVSDHWPVVLTLVKKR